MIYKTTTTMTTIVYNLIQSGDYIIISSNSSQGTFPKGAYYVGTILTNGTIKYDNVGYTNDVNITNVTIVNPNSLNFSVRVQDRQTAIIYPGDGSFTTEYESPMFTVPWDNRVGNSMTISVMLNNNTCQCPPVTSTYYSGY